MTAVSPQPTLAQVSKITRRNPMPVEDNKAVVQAIYDHFNRHDLDRTVTLVTPDFELIDFAMGQTFHGPDGFRQWLQGHLTPLPDARVEVVSIVAEGDWVATEHIGRGTHDGPLMTHAGEVPPTGRSVELKVAEFFELRKGKVQRMRAYFDQGAIMREFGLTEAAEPAHVKA